MELDVRKATLLQAVAHQLHFVITLHALKGSNGLGREKAVRWWSAAGVGRVLRVLASSSLVVLGVIIVLHPHAIFFNHDSQPWWPLATQGHSATRHGPNRRLKLLQPSGW